MQKRYLKIFIIALILALVAVFGYLYPRPKSEAAPVRILLDNNAGRVVFDHQKHIQDYGLDCQSCHHDLPENKEVINSDVISCGTCHGVVFDEAFKVNHLTNIENQAACATCHHIEFQNEDYQLAKWAHDKHVEEYGLECTSCHHDELIEPEPTNCANCHESEDLAVPTESAGLPIGLKYAVHTKCADCHADMFEAKTAACSNCHVEVKSSQVLENTGKYAPQAFYANCSTCHEQAAQDLIPDRMSAFHGKCISCHEEIGSGPYTQEQCNQCHIL